MGSRASLRLSRPPKRRLREWWNVHGEHIHSIFAMERRENTRLQVHDDPAAGTEDHAVAELAHLRDRHQRPRNDGNQEDRLHVAVGARVGQIELFLTEIGDLSAGTHRELLGASATRRFPQRISRSGGGGKHTCTTDPESSATSSSRSFHARLVRRIRSPSRMVSMLIGAIACRRPTPYRD